MTDDDKALLIIAAVLCQTSGIDLDEPDAVDALAAVIEATGQEADRDSLRECVELMRLVMQTAGKTQR